VEFAEELGNVDEKVSNSYYPSPLAEEGYRRSFHGFPSPVSNPLRAFDPPSPTARSFAALGERGRKKASHRRRYFVSDLSQLLLAQEDIEPSRDNDRGADQRRP
jgi:hypothetical protein